MSEAGKENKAKETIAEKLKQVMDPDAAMGSSRSVTRTQEKEAVRLSGNDEGVYDDNGKLIGRVGKNVDGTYQPYTNDASIGRTYPTKPEAVDAVKRAHKAAGT